MNSLVNRPNAILAPGNGLLRNDCFQVAYATNDVERACSVFGQRFGVREFRRLEGQLPAGGHIRVELAWAGGTMYELFQCEGPGSAFFNSVLPPEGFAIRHHHLGFFVRDMQGWEAVHREIKEGGWTLHSNSYNAGFLRACIVEVPELGHYLEYILPEPAGAGFFATVPSN
jgi:catechol 2,3-dioxygenase-like lactoylglutathione lyase family enzyme